MKECLDFHLAEQVMAGPGNSIQAATWMFRSSTPHDIAFVGGPANGLHHIVRAAQARRGRSRAGDSFRVSIGGIGACSMRFARRSVS